MITGWTTSNKNKFKALYKDIVGSALINENESDIDSLPLMDRNKMSKLDTGEPYTQYENRTKEQMYNLARELDISGRSNMNKDELIAAVRDER